MKKNNKVSLLLSEIVKNQEYFCTMSLKDRWWIINNSQIAVELFIRSIHERGTIKNVVGQYNWVWKEPEKKKRGSLKIPMILSVLVVHQGEIGRLLSEEDIEWAIEKNNLVIEFFIEVVLNRKIMYRIKKGGKK